MPDCVAIRHLPFEDLDAWEGIIRERFDFRYFDIVGDIPRQPLSETCDPDLLVVLGGPVGVHDAEEYPFIQAELRLLAARLEQHRPTLGICLGAQLMAQALGARVHANATREIGWQPLQLTTAGHDSPLRHLEPDNNFVFHWHSDNFDLPPTSERLASTPGCANQAFRIGRNILGLQFHPEVSANGLETWYVGHHRALASQQDLSASQLRRDAAEHAGALAQQGRLMLAEWLDGLSW